MKVAISLERFQWPEYDSISTTAAHSSTQQHTAAHSSVRSGAEQSREGSAAYIIIR
eukprot:COSAG06_NODE_9323_length_1929_cov_2.013115_1_plen_56_part_00